MSHRLVIFGASGDLTSRKLMPALAQLHEVGQLPPGSPASWALAQDNWGTHRLREALERTTEMSACQCAERARLCGRVPRC